MEKNLAAVQETWVQSLVWEGPLEDGMATHSSILAWWIPMDRGAWQATVHGVAESDMIEWLSTAQTSGISGSIQSKILWLTNNFGWCPLYLGFCSPHLWFRNNDQIQPTCANEPGLPNTEQMPGWALEMGDERHWVNEETLMGTSWAPVCFLPWSLLPHNGQPWGHSQAKKATLQDRWNFF